MKPAIILILFLFTGTLFAQSKPDTTKAKTPVSITLSLDKLGARFGQSV